MKNVTIKEKKKMNRILIVLTGGTICSFADGGGERASDTKLAQTLIVENFRNGQCAYRSEECVVFESEFALNILSENMTVTHWNTLIEKLKTYDFSVYDGIIILHGTDTLAYTSSMLSILLSGTPVPVFLVSSQLPLYEKEANGNANFRAAVEMIVNGIRPNVYVAYRNEEISAGRREQTMYVHYGAHLIQCANHSNNFYSSDMTPVDQTNAFFEGKPCKTKIMPLNSFEKITAKVLKIEPYVGIDYSVYNPDNVDAVIHGTYHSGTMTVNPYDNPKDALHGSDDMKLQHSILYLKSRCDSHTPQIPVFIEPCDKEAYSYETTGIALRNGMKAIHGITSEMCYVKVLLGCSMGLRDDELYNFVQCDINGEFVL